MCKLLFPFIIFLVGITTGVSQEKDATIIRLEQQLKEVIK